MALVHKLLQYDFTSPFGHYSARGTNDVLFFSSAVTNETIALEKHKSNPMCQCSALTVSLQLVQQQSRIVTGGGDIATAAGPVDVCKVVRKVAGPLDEYSRISSPALSLGFSLPGRTRKVCAPK